ncbi:hypothetical protein H6G89_04590 [Oscillatoria sp. FACHB-1407]|uniref:hypothetical protein n=1 Tax=Oscillatoria sp. FACHB-1407 TaxID=2692847 RepID=UPI001689B7C4|nr:hypothetical protein [Oscillatoria sp. FACHB-1407]MBD2460315.1 hypothetical protein [Oscillatoria sp. FACHB-1407]
MSLTATAPRFCRDQAVRFLGGEGTIKSYQSDAGHWTYLVEMPMGPEPEMGRIGYETTITLLESDLEAL